MCLKMGGLQERLGWAMNKGILIVRAANYANLLCIPTVAGVLKSG